MSELIITRGNSQLDFEGVTNLIELRDFAEKKANEYRNIIVSEGNIKECESTIKELTPYRTEIKKYRASLNKELAERVKIKLKEVDDITSILTNVIEPVTSAIDEFKEIKRLERLNRKKNKFMPHIEKVNTQLKEILNNLKYADIEEITFNENWANINDDNIIIEIEKLVNETKNKIKFYQERINSVTDFIDKLKNEYDLISDINFDIIKEKIYNDNYKELLEEIAVNQQCIEMTAKEEIEVKPIKSENSKEIKLRIDLVLDTNLSLNEIENKMLNTFSIKKISLTEF